MGEERENMNGSLDHFIAEISKKFANKEAKEEANQFQNPPRPTRCFVSICNFQDPNLEDTQSQSMDEEDFSFRRIMPVPPPSKEEQTEILKKENAELKQKVEELENKLQEKEALICRLEYELSFHL